MNKTYEVKGMSCVICRNAVEKGLRELKGVHHADVNLMDNEVTIDFDESITNEQIFSDTLKDLGYELVITKRKKKDITNLKLIFSVLLMIILMVISMTSMDHVADTMIIQSVLSAIIIGLHFRFYISGFSSLLGRNPNMDSLVAISSSVSYLYSVYTMFRIYEGKSGHLYFETASMVLLIVAIGKKIEERNKKKTTKVIRGLSTLIPMNANLKKGNETVVISTDELKKDDVIIIKAGESIPQDAIVLEGSSLVDESLITGESALVKKEKDSLLIGGTINTSGQMTCKVTKNASQTVLSNIISLTKQATLKKIPIERFADQISRYFVSGVLIISFITFLSWYIGTKDIETALNFSMSVLVISCPCALGLATPSAITVACSSAARNGLLIRNPEILETAWKIKTVIFDKTGTLTENRMKVIDTKEYDPSLNKVINALERNSSHPIAKAILEKYRDTSFVIDSIEEISGEGISSKDYWAGNLSLAIKNGIEFNGKENKPLNHTVIYVGNKNRLLGVISVSDTLKNSAYRAMKQFQKRNIHTIMATGDNRYVAEEVSAKLKIDETFAEVKPEDKQKILTEARKNGLTAMVGDGINDAIALTSADVSFTLNSATDIAHASSDVILMHNNLSDIPFLMELSDLTMKKIKQNLFWAFLYNALFIPMAAGVFYPAFSLSLNPMIGAFTMSCSSAFVLLNALTISKLKKEEIKMNKTVKIEGMMCIHCQARVEKALKELGVEATVSHEQGNAVISSTDIEDSAIIKAIEDAGYSVTEIIHD